MGIGSILRLGGRALKCIPEFVFGDSAQVIGKAYKASSKSSIWSKAKDAGKAFESHVGKLSVTKGSFFTRLFKNTISLPKALNFSRKAGVRLAKMKGTNTFIGGLKGIGKGLSKKMPYIGALLTLAFEIPNMIKGYKKEGVKGALKQAAGAGIELGCMSAGAAIGSCFPGVGTLIGGIVGGIVGMAARHFIAPEPTDTDDVKTRVVDNRSEQADSSSDSSSSSSGTSESSNSGSSSGTGTTSETTGSSGSTGTTTTTTPYPTNTGLTNPFGMGLNIPNPVSIGFNPYNFGVGSNPFTMNPGIGLGNPFGGLTGIGMYNSPDFTFTNTLLQPGENIFLKYPSTNYRFQYYGQ